ncbi:hypothetical protein CF168_06005 [Shewanella bicestrii]|uniref:Uncharacterized protein n=1 Tax=Shewanella bicestrii TaxID=2018305 RepID=A0A220UKD8_9GAMM|nr:hypothetical protein CF168_06005 [Shewanella bicestrii]
MLSKFYVQYYLHILVWLQLFFNVLCRKDEFMRLSAGFGLNCERWQFVQQKLSILFAEFVLFKCICKK